MCNRAHGNTPLHELPFIARDSDAGYIAELSGWMREHDLNPSHHALVINDVETIMTMVERGLGWSVLPDICLDRFIGIIRPIELGNGKRFARRTHVLYRADYMLLPQARAFLAAAQEAEQRSGVRSPADAGLGPVRDGGGGRPLPAPPRG